MSKDFTKNISNYVVSVKDFGAKGDTIYVPSTGEYSGTDDTEAIRAALATGRRVFFPKGLYTVTGELEVIHPGQVIEFENGGGYGYGAVSNALPHFSYNTAIIAKGTFAKRVRTRRKFRGSSSDPQDDPISVVWNIQAPYVQMLRPCVSLYCDYSNSDFSNRGDDCDVAIFVGTRFAVQIFDPIIVGYFRNSGIYYDVTQAFGLPRFNSLAGAEYPSNNMKSGGDGCSLWRPYIRGSRRALAIMGASPKIGENGYTDPYYDEITGTTATDGRGTFGFSDFCCFGGRLYGTLHHSGRRSKDPELDGGVLTLTSLLAEPELAPSILHISGMAGNASGHIWGMNFFNTRFASNEAINIRLDRASRIGFHSCPFDGMSGSAQDTAGNSIDQSDFTTKTYGHVCSTTQSSRNVITNTGRQTIDDTFPHFYGSSIKMDTATGRTFTLGDGYTQSTTKLDWRVASGNIHQFRHNATTSFQIQDNGVQFGTAGPIDYWGTGSPESVITAVVGSTFRRTNGGTGTSFYVKESGTGNTGWVAK